LEWENFSAYLKQVGTISKSNQTNENHRKGGVIICILTALLNPEQHPELPDLLTA
jgi:hypothetical protein